MTTEPTSHITSWHTSGWEVRAVAKGSWLELGDLREVVRQADELGLDDRSDVYATGLTTSAIYVGRAHVNELTVIHKAYVKHQEADHA